MKDTAPKVLVLEDSTTQARLISRMFEALGVETICFSSALSFKTLGHLSRSPVAAALIDVHFGEVSGLSMLAPVQKIWPGIPMIMMTANSKDDYRALGEAREHGVDLVLPKPFKNSDLQDLLLDIASIRQTGVRRRHVVLIDDSAATRRIVQNMLEEMGYRASAFEDGLSAIQKLSFDHVDVVLTDINMPEMGGDEIIHLVRDVRGDVGIVAMSGDLKLCKNRSMIDGFVPKPFVPAELHRAIENALPALVRKPFDLDDPEPVAEEPKEDVFVLDI